MGATPFFLSCPLATTISSLNFSSAHGKLHPSDLRENQAFLALRMGEKHVSRRYRHIIAETVLSRNIRTVVTLLSSTPVSTIALFAGSIFSLRNASLSTKTRSTWGTRRVWRRRRDPVIFPDFT
jgi:hypothetical protein